VYLYNLSGLVTEASSDAMLLSLRFIDQGKGKFIVFCVKQRQKKTTNVNLDLDFFNSSKIHTTYGIHQTDE
jgi:hypothetical protein